MTLFAKTIFALITAISIYVLFFMTSVMIENYSIDPWGVIKPHAWLSPLLRMAGLLFAGLVFVFVMLMLSGRKRRR